MHPQNLEWALQQYAASLTPPTPANDVSIPDSVYAELEGLRAEVERLHHVAQTDELTVSLHPRAGKRSSPRYHHECERSEGARERNPEKLGDDVSDSRELDARVAVEVMGWKEISMAHPPGGAISPTPPSGFDVRNNRYARLPRYSTDIRAAWEVVEKMASDGWALDLQWKVGGREFSHTAEASFTRWNGADRQMGHSFSATAPMAICLAALKAKGETT